MKSARVAVAAISVALFLGGCGADPTSQPAADNDNIEATVSNKVTGHVSEWEVDVSAGKAEAGEVIFAIANFGTIQHEFLVTKTTYEPGKIPVGANNRFDEEDPGIEVIDEIAEWPVNEANVLKVNLEPGTYELLCNIEGHYANGMHHTFIVE